jgi:hypothetical protein
MISLLEDDEIWTAIMRNAQSLPLGAFGSLAMTISPWAMSKAEELKSMYLSQNYLRIVSKLKSSSIKRLKKSIPLMARVTNLNRFMREFSVTDYQYMIKCSQSHSTINTIRVFFFALEKWGIENSTKQRLAEALTSLPESDLTELIGRKCNSLFRLGGLVGNLRKVDNSIAEECVVRLSELHFSIAEEFVKRLSELDLNGLFLREDIPGKEAGFTKLAIINFFLSKQISFAPRYAERLVCSITNDTWLRLIDSAKIGDGFWMLWNVYRNNRQKAQGLIKEGLALSLLNKTGFYEKRIWSRLIRRGSTLSEEESNYILPVLGLLNECGFDISGISLPRETVAHDLDKLLARFQKWGLKGKPQPTLFILSLITLSVKMRSEYEHEIKSALTQEPMHAHVYRNDDIQVREILMELIKKYAL